MHKIFTFVLTLFLSMSLMAGTADAKRFGGGQSFGKQKQNISQQAAPRTPSTAPAAPASTGNKWLGPLAGLAAGGLLASLFMGGAFDGIKGMDILLMLALAAGAFFLFRALRKTANGAKPQPQAAAYSAFGQSPSATTDIEKSNFASGGSGSNAAIPRPDWFDETAFVRDAKTHFIRLQAAYDAADLNDIREYTTPEVFAEVSMQIQERGAATQKTEVTLLNADMLDIDTDNEYITVSVRFHGLIREETNAPAEPFNEIWYIQKPASDRKAPWHIAGIQQA